MGVRGWGAFSPEGPSKLEPKDRRNQHVKPESLPGEASGDAKTLRLKVLGVGDAERMAVCLGTNGRRVE